MLKSLGSSPAWSSPKSPNPVPPDLSDLRPRLNFCGLLGPFRGAHFHCAIIWLAARAPWNKVNEA